MTRLVITAALACFGTCPAVAAGPSQAQGDITVRTEGYPRPPYSGATYYFYERANQVVCTKLEVCNKFDECSVEYRKGLLKDEQDRDPFERTDPVPIAAAKLVKHKCLTRFGLAK